MRVQILDASSDLQALSRLHGQGFDPAWSAESLAELLNASAFGFALGADASPDGFILVRAVAEEAEILTLVVAKQKRRSGLGRTLVLAAVSEAEQRGARAIFLEVDVANSAARSLYEKLGFVAVGRRAGYYRNSPLAASDALTLRADLPLAAMGKPVRT